MKTAFLLSLSLIVSCGFAALAAPDAKVKAKIDDTVLTVDDKNMLLIKTAGSMLGASEICFSKHGIGATTSTGQIIWNDADPGHVQVLNGENKAYIKQTIEEALGDLDTGMRPLLYNQNLKPVESRLYDGKKALKLTVTNPLMPNQSKPFIAEIIYLPQVKLPPNVLQTWCILLSVKSQLGLPVGLRHNHPRRKDEKFSDDSRWRKVIGMRSVSLVPLDPSRFKMPRGSRFVKDKTAFYFSEDGNIKQADIDDLFRSGVR